MERPIAAVFGATGFLGRHLVACLSRRGWRVRAVSRHREGDSIGDEAVTADILDPDSLPPAVASAQLVVNAVSLYAETRRVRYRDVHVVAAGNLAHAARGAGVARLVQLSGIGADATARNAYIRARGEGEAAVVDAFDRPLIVRPSVMCGPGDAFVAPLAAMMRKVPVLPLFGRGRTRLQPVAVGDVAEAIARLAEREETPSAPVEIGGGSVVTYRQALAVIGSAVGRRPALVPVPFALWRVGGFVGERLPGAPLTRAVVALMDRDNVAADDDWRALADMTPRGFGQLVTQTLGHRPPPPRR